VTLWFWCRGCWRGVGCVFVVGDVLAVVVDGDVGVEAFVVGVVDDAADVDVF